MAPLPQRVRLGRGRNRGEGAHPLHSPPGLRLGCLRVRREAEPVRAGGRAREWRHGRRRSHVGSDPQRRARIPPSLLGPVPGRPSHRDRLPVQPPHGLCQCAGGFRSTDVLLRAAAPGRLVRARLCVRPDAGTARVRRDAAFRGPRGGSGSAGGCSRTGAEECYPGRARRQKCALERGARAPPDAGVGSVRARGEARRPRGGGRRDAFQQAIRRATPRGFTFQGVPLQFPGRCQPVESGPILAGLLDDPAAMAVLAVRDPAASFALRVMIFPYPEGVCCVGDAGGPVSPARLDARDRGCPPPLPAPPVPHINE